MTIAVYPGTFDPITSGHLSVVREGVRLFAHVRILVAVHPTKEPLFSLDERIALAREVVGRMPTVSVGGTDGMVVEYARLIGATALLRGLRGAADAEYETRMAQTNRELAGEILTVMLPAEPSLSMVSSSELKRRARAGEPIDAYCPPAIARRLRERLAEEGGS